MAAQTLTPERRDELAALLDDPQRLQNEHPKVANYLAAAPTMSGTGNHQADATFDLRLVHYMTGDHSISANPYWDIVAPAVAEHEDRRVVNGGHPSGSTRLAFAQTILQEVYAYAIPSPGTIQWITQFCADQSIVEVGAGRGYWAAQLSHAGLMVDAYDIEPPNESNNISFPQSAGQLNTWHSVKNLDALKSRSSFLADHVLLLCWPPGWGNTMASETLTWFEHIGGRKLIYIGELKGQQTGDNAFFDILSERWKRGGVDSQHVSWWNATDVVQGWIRR